MRTTALATAGIVAVAALALSGCAAGDAGDDGEVTITYTNFISNDGNEENLQKIVDAFEEENPGVTVEVTTLPYADYGTALQTDLAAGTVSDVFDIEYANYAQYQANGVLAELSVEEPDAYRQSVLEAYQTDGVQYALPSSFSTVVLFYNRDLFDAAGLDYPSSDWTWAEEQAAAEQLTDAAAGTWGDHQPVSFYEFYKVLAQNGGEFLDESGTKAAFNSPEGVEAAEWLVGKSGTVMPTIEQGQGTPDFDTKLFTDGKLGMLHTGIWMFGAFAELPFGWDIAVEPGNARQRPAGQRALLERGRRLGRLRARRRGRGVRGVPHLERRHGADPPRRRVGAAGRRRRGGARKLPRARQPREPPGGLRLARARGASPGRGRRPAGDAGHRDRGARRGAVRPQVRRGRARLRGGASQRRHRRLIRSGAGMRLPAPALHAPDAIIRTTMEAAHA
jgi:multiple sugar transport system substrate-binding protein